MDPLKYILTIVLSIMAIQFFGQKTQSQFADLIIEAKYSGSNAQFSFFYGGDISILGKRG